MTRLDYKSLKSFILHILENRTNYHMFFHVYLSISNELNQNNRLECKSRFLEGEKKLKLELLSLENHLHFL